MTEVGTWDYCFLRRSKIPAARLKDLSLGVRRKVEGSWGDKGRTSGGKEVISWVFNGILMDVHGIFMEFTWIPHGISWDLFHGFQSQNGGLMTFDGILPKKMDCYLFYCICICLKIRFRFFRIPAFLLFLLLCFSCFSSFSLFCFSAFCFSCFSAFLLLCLSTSTCFSAVMRFCCSTSSCSFASLLPFFTVSLLFFLFCFILCCLYP